MTFEEQREELAGLMQHVLDVSTKLDDANLSVNEQLRTIRFILRSELSHYDMLIRVKAGGVEEPEWAICYGLDDGLVESLASV